MRLLLMRHANAEISDDKQDFERLLTERGKIEAKSAANFLHQYKIDKMLVSYVKRTIQTSGIIQEKITPAELEIVTELYQGNINTITNLLNNQEDHNKHILVIGHNPLIFEVALSFTNPNSSKYEFLLSSMMPTARIIVLDFPEMCSWHELLNNKGNIIEIFTPPMLEA